MDKKRKFMDILKIEIEDAKDDIDLFIEHLSDEHDKGGISNYVFYANKGTYENEKLGINDVLHTMNEIDPNNYDSIAELADALREHFKKQFEEHGLVKAGLSLLDKKITRVLGYMEKNSISF